MVRGFKPCVSSVLTAWSLVLSLSFPHSHSVSLSKIKININKFVFKYREVKRKSKVPVLSPILINHSDVLNPFVTQIHMLFFKNHKIKGTWLISFFYQAYHNYFSYHDPSLTCLSWLHYSVIQLCCTK